MKSQCVQAQGHQERAEVVVVRESRAAMKHPEGELDADAVLLHHHAGLLHLAIVVEHLPEPEVKQEAFGAAHLDSEHSRVRGIGHDVDGQDVHRCFQVMR